jgi:S-DNA-T family DNA segregation ATPase FtsK/SpoIIIE
MAGKANTYKNPAAEEPEEKAKNNPGSDSKKGFFKSTGAFFKDERFHKISGLLLLLLSVYLLIAFTSFLFTWKTDQDKVSASWLEMLGQPDITVENWLGKLGAIVSHQFMHNWFGISSYLIAFLLFITGFRILFGFVLFSIKRAYQYTFFAVIWFSSSLAFINHSDNLLFLGGAFGLQTNKWLQSAIGMSGTGILLFFLALVFLVIAFNISFALPKKKPDALKSPDEPITPSDKVENTLRNEVLQHHEPIVSKAPVMEFMEEEEHQESFIEIDEEKEEEEEHKTLVLEHVLANSEVPILIEEPLIEEKTFEIPEETVPTGEYDPKLDLSSYQFPHIDLLENHGGSKIQVNKEELEMNSNKIVATLGHYSIEISQIKATIGPTVTLYEIVPKAGVRISKIKNLEDDIALSLAALGIRIIAPIPGKGTIGIEVPNQKPEIVSMRSILQSEKFLNAEMDLPIALGKTISNEVFITDLAKMPHLLMAGATGQGKSVGLNAVLVSLLYKKHPSQVKFVLVDPKKVELTLFKKIERHFLAKLPGEEEAIITDVKKVINTLNSLCMEMDDRYNLLKDAQVRNIKEYNAKFIARRLNPNNGHHFLPYIVLVVDEFADLIMTAGKEVEMPIARLAQLARAIGIHLIIATQRPSVNIITGTIKANFPARIAFRVTSKIDSRTILDSGGADQLIGRGDMLLSTGSDLIRLQCAFVDTPEVEKITDFIGSQRGYPEAHLLPEFHGTDDEGASSKEFNSGERDSYFEEAARIIVQHQQGSTSLLQRRLKLGYNRAGRIVDQLEAAGIIGPFEGSKAREVLFPDLNSLEQFLNTIK